MDYRGGLSYDKTDQSPAPALFPAAAMDYKLPPEELDTEFKKEFPPDAEIGREMEDAARVWKVYRKEANAHDSALLDGWSSTLDILLIFAGLFSALATAFVIESYQAFQPDSAADAAAALYTLVSATNHCTGITFPAPPNLQNASSLASWINGLWFTSLLLSLIVALLGILAKQCIAETRAQYLASAKSPRGWAHRQYSRALHALPVAELVSLLPVMLLLSLLLLFAGVVAFLWTLDTAMGICFIGFGSLLAIFYIGYTLLPQGVWVRMPIIEANAHDSALLDGWSSTLDILLILAGLFSLATTAFVVESYHLLQPDSAAYTAEVLYTLVSVTNHSTGIPLPAPPNLQHASSLARWINGLWFTSLLLSLIVALLGILVKECIDETRTRYHAAKGPRGWTYRQYSRALHALPVAELVSLLPIMLLLSLFSFFAGLVALFCTLDTAIGICFLGLGALLTIFYIGYTLLPQGVWVRRPIREANAHDSALLDGWISSLDNLLLFAGLLSAAVTVFVIENNDLLQPDLAAYTAAALYTLVSATNHSTGITLPAPPNLQNASSLALWINGLWFTSLLLSLIVALLGILVKECIAETRAQYLASATSPRGWAHRQYSRALHALPVAELVSLLPVMLYLSLFLFFAGVVAFRWTLDTAIGIRTIMLGALLAIFYIASTPRKGSLAELLGPRAFAAAPAMVLRAGHRLVPRFPTGAEQHYLPTIFVVRPVFPLAMQQSTSPPVTARAIITTLYVQLSRIFRGRIQSTVSPNADRIRNITHEIHNISCKPVGYGGYSDIYTGMWYSVYGETKVAIKVIRAAPDHSQSGKLPRVLRHEISVWKRLLHPNVHVMCGFYEGIGSLPALVSPWYENGDIKEYLRRLAADPDIGILKLRLLGDVMTGLKFLHDHHIVHGDIKGGNVFISDDGVAQLSDFGLSRLLLENSQSIEQSGVRGTTRWMAPELLLVDGARHSFASDIWAYGCLCIEVWSDDRPYHTKSNEQQVILALSRNEQPCRPADTPEHLWYIVNECCNADAAARPAPQDIIEYIRLRATTERIFRIALPSRSNDAANGSDVRRQIEERMRGLDSRQISDLWLLLDKELVVEVVRLRIVLPLGSI